MVHESNQVLDDASEGETLPRTSEDVRRHVADTIGAEDGAERLLAGGSHGNSSGRSWASRRLHSGKQVKSLHKESEKRELMYDTEEGGLRDSSPEASSVASEGDAKEFQTTQTFRKRSKRRRICGFAVVHMLVAAAFLALLYGAWSASHLPEKTAYTDAELPVPVDEEGAADEEAHASTSYRPHPMSNGSHIFEPTTILISLDGFRADFLQRHISPTLRAFMERGVSPKYMLPSFPSLTFPNHFTLVTGLHPESHGIVGNTFWDPEREAEFYYTDPARSMQPEWWQAEPIWVTAEKAGLKTAVHMWPGSEVEGGIEGVQASYVDHFNADEHLGNKVNRILGWLDLPGTAHNVDGEVRPQLIAAYVPDVDADGHKYGPNSTYIRSTIMEVDGMLRTLLAGLETRNLTGIVNVVIVSDHGMSTTSVSRLIQLEDLVDTGLVEHTDGWPLYGLRPHNISKLQEIHKALLVKAESSPYKHAFDVYMRDVDMPARYHFTNNNRIAPLWIVPKAGWAIVTKEEYDLAHMGTRPIYHPRGLHGYDNQHPLMRAIFIARGPAFPHAPGSELEPFQNTEVYNIICDSLGIEPVANNGTLRLPLVVAGLHDPDQVVETPHDPQDDSSIALPPEVPNLAHPPESAFGAATTMPELAAATTMPPEVANLANRPDFMVPTANIPPVPSDRPTHAIVIAPEASKAEHISALPSDAEEADDDVASRPVVHDGVSDDEKTSINRWWEWVTGKIDAIKQWASDKMSKEEVETSEGEQLG
ncbi:hypothetical protein LTR62_005425 [Meristemomyces frigidus]|uniref:Phosphodiest-domain-containing protein n=1 Tax=Meristemomyces frigidus TaxID=1508187 RepID=A0AAN7TEQ8_9PEZI|nr:hypothetical protein LTR62_005425 [Meristemomyces frigidus]